MNARRLLLAIAAVPFGLPHAAELQLGLRAPAREVGQFRRLELRIEGVPPCADPFDPAQADLRVEFTGPDGRPVVVPAFFAQQYERDERPGAPADWIHPVGDGAWLARFAPTQLGRHRAVALLAGTAGNGRSAPLEFDSVASPSKGFLRVARKDPRFLEFDNGEPFFAIGQNLAFVGEQQYVTPAKAREIVPKLAAHGVNYLRVWACAGDWALAIEARKSAWTRSWEKQGRLVPDPADPARKCLGFTSARPTAEVNPSHPLHLHPDTRHVVSGRIRTEAGATLRLDAPGSPPPLRSDQPTGWTAFRHEFRTGPREWRLPPLRFRLEGEGLAWLADLSLRETGGGPELLWEADMNRPARGFFNPLDCHWLDELVACAEQHGVVLQLCMLARDLYMKDLANPAGQAYDQALAAAKKFFRHAIARWGASTSVAAWEYWNEMDPAVPTQRFHAELGEFLARHDPWRHLRSTSTWAPCPRDCRDPNLDLADVHFYLRPADKPRLADEVEAVLDRARWLREQAPRKPALIGEFGLADDQWRITGEMRRSANLDDVRHALWASALSGISGTALPWWWERIDQNNGHLLYRPLSRFLAGVPWNGGELQPLEASCRQPQLRLVGLRTQRKAWFWLFDPAAAWAKAAVAGATPPPRDDVTLEIPAWPATGARLEWHDTRSGEITPAEAVAASGSLRLVVPAFRGDLACRVSAP